MRHKWITVTRGKWTRTQDYLECSRCGLGPISRNDARRGMGPCRPTKILDSVIRDTIRARDKELFGVGRFVYDDGFLLSWKLTPVESMGE